MWIFIIIIAIVVLVFSFNSAQNKNITDIYNEGGIGQKYSYLIKKISHGQMQVLAKTNTSITIGATEQKQSFEFHIIKTFNTVNILYTYKCKFPVPATHNLSWEFPQNGDQEDMVNQIFFDIKNLVHKLNMATF
ncbi:hypothetical protein FFWV33_02305 [Flavobacterium faecale]|uniref:Uncharacterized protein n=1 Tax=Flavobacterium faecale TaxID=1355330 RepID=A0A2S1L9P4_9FLAO|nr:hypothetical protein [Flavobacterium faecale]AWG20442.1 hypothetical protein FFWV33_02305 [Flavobacterium faecale]